MVLKVAFFSDEGPGSHFVGMKFFEGRRIHMNFTDASACIENDGEPLHFVPFVPNARYYVMNDAGVTFEHFKAETYVPAERLRQRDEFEAPLQVPAGVEGVAAVS